jgi:CheY-like chemotaxis protein
MLNPNLAVKNALVIDDQERWRKTISLLLKSRGYTVIEAMDLVTAMDALANYKVNLVTIDMQFTEQGDELGEILLEFIRNEYPTVACIMISGSVDSFARVDDLEGQGLGAFIHKNELTPRLLDRAIEKARRVAEQQSRIEATDILQEYQRGLPKLELNLAKQKNILIQLQSILLDIQEKAAKYGMDIPTHVLSEINDYKQKYVKAEEDIVRINYEISEIKRKISELRGS